MTTARPERTGVLIVRVWIEASSPSGVRARITETKDLEEGERTSTVTGTREEIVAIVSEWLDAFAADSGDGRVTAP